MTDRSTELERARRKARAVLNARFALKRALEKIDYDLDTVRPALRELDAGAAIGELPVITSE